MEIVPLDLEYVAHLLLVAENNEVKIALISYRKETKLDLAN